MLGYFAFLLSKERGETVEIPQLLAGLPSKKESSFVSSRIWSSQVGPGLA